MARETGKGSSIAGMAMQIETVTVRARALVVGLVCPASEESDGALRLLRVGQVYYRALSGRCGQPVREFGAFIPLGGSGYCDSKSVHAWRTSDSP